MDCNLGGFKPFFKDQQSYDLEFFVPIFYQELTERYSGILMNICKDKKSFDRGYLKSIFQGPTEIQ